MKREDQLQFAPGQILVLTISFLPGSSLEEYLKFEKKSLKTKKFIKFLVKCLHLGLTLNNRGG
jgi:hypothetical protein